MSAGFRLILERLELGLRDDAAVMGRLSIFVLVDFLFGGNRLNGGFPDRMLLLGRILLGSFRLFGLRLGRDLGRLGLLVVLLGFVLLGLFLGLHEVLARL